MGSTGRSFFRLPAYSIGAKLIGGFIAVLAVIVSVGLLSVNVATQITRREVRQSYRRSLNTLTAELGSDLERLEGMVDALSGYDDIHVLNQSPPGPRTVLRMLDLLEQLTFYSLIYRTDSILDVYLLRQERRYSSLDRISAFPEEQHDGLFDTFQPFQGHWKIHDSPFGRSGRLLTYARFAGMYPSRRGVVLTVAVEESTMQRILEFLPVEHGGLVFLIDPSGEIILPATEVNSDIAELIASRYPDGDSASLAATEPTVRIAGEIYRLLFAEPGRTGLIVGLALPEHRITAPIRTIRTWMLVLAAVSLVLGAAFAIFEHRSILRPIRNLIAGMERVQEGSFEQVIETPRGDEIGVLQKQFNTMVGRIATLLDEVNVEHLKYERAQLRLLQSQVNPHFLYNSLNLIYRFSVAGDTGAVSQLALHLARYYRTVTRSTGNTVTVESELEHAATYMEIHRIRQPERFSYRIDVADDVRDVAIPHLIVQPLVENAIVHGLQNMERPGSVTITAYRRSESAVIDVRDDGVGIDRSTLQSVENRIRDPYTDNDDRNHIGLSNCFWRLRLRYGSAAGIELEQNVPSGVVTRIVVPHNGGTEEEDDRV